jgi:hypothetical protein
MYVKRDNEGRIRGLSRKQQTNMTEWVEGAEIYIDPNLKMVGVEVFGVMCSATKEDMWGLNSIKDWVAAGNDVNFEFDNGNVLTLTKDNYAEFEAVWIPFRAGFF